MPRSLPDLPVAEALGELRDALSRHRSAVLSAPAGAGKTTLVPLALLDEPWMDGGRMVVLEPRRLATRAAARRMAHLLGEEAGQTVGYRTRDESRTSAATRIEVVTEGVLTRRLQADPGLDGTTLVVFDEVHERNLHGELGLALTLDCRRTLRPELRVLAMSATVEGQRFAELLGDDGTASPIVASVGRMFPVDLRWAPPPPRTRTAEALASLIRRAVREETGDVLVFLPGAALIDRVARLLADPPLRDHLPVDVRPLHGSLASEDQDRALRPDPTQRRVILSTDIAETSLTVEGVRVVVDAGLARVPRHDSATGMTTLRTVPAPRSSADQRLGRAGRTQPGVAYRAWSQMEHAGRRPHRDPEIVEADLAPLALELALWGTSERDLRWLTPPPPAALAEGRSLLRTLGALDGDDRPTPAGAAMAKLPLHPRLAHLLVVHADGPDAPTAVVLAALLEERDILRGRPEELPSSLGLRIDLVADPTRSHVALDHRARDLVRRRARDLVRRSRQEGPVDLADASGERAGAVASAAYPDRIAQSAGGPGRFRLRSGQAARVGRADELAAEDFLVVGYLDGTRKEGRIRLAAAINPDEVAIRFIDQVDEFVSLRWDRDRNDLVARTETRLGSLKLSVVDRRPDPSPATTAALVKRVRDVGLDLLPWTAAARRLQQRLGFVKHHQPEAGWPAVDDAALRRTLGEWLTPYLPAATGRADLDVLDIGGILAALVGTRVPGGGRLVDRLAPDRIDLASGRRVQPRYDAEGSAVVAARAQDLYGTTVHPTVLDGRVPLTVEVLSPADRPIQTTSDLPGFWIGSWADVRKEMAGRYPKHDWPEDAAAAPPPSR